MIEDMDWMALSSVMVLRLLNSIYGCDYSILDLCVIILEAIHQIIYKIYNFDDLLIFNKILKSTKVTQKNVIGS